jgi:hypothetical protein
MPKTKAPRAQTTPALAQWREGQSAPQRGEELGSACIRGATVRERQDAREPEPAEACGRGRSERQPSRQGACDGEETGPVKTVAGVFRVPLPHVSGRRAPYRSKRGAARGRTSAVRTRLLVELRRAGGRRGTVRGRGPRRWASGWSRSEPSAI